MDAPNPCFELEPVEVPRGMQGVHRAYRVRTARFLPALVPGDLICCAAPTDGPQSIGHYVSAEGVSISFSYEGGGARPAREQSASKVILIIKE